MRGAKLRVVLGLAGVVACLAVAGMAQDAVKVSFACVTFNNATDAATGHAQLTATVGKTGDSASDVVYLTFANTGTAPCSIARVYLDGAGVSALDVVSQSAGVSFSAKANGPRDLPGGNAIGFAADVMIGAKPPVQPNGVNPGESLVLAIRPAAGLSPAAILAAIANGYIKIGIHVQGFAGGGSESFAGVPAPSETPHPNE